MSPQNHSPGGRGQGEKSSDKRKAEGAAAQHRPKHAAGLGGGNRQPGIRDFLQLARRARTTRSPTRHRQHGNHRRQGSGLKKEPVRPRERATHIPREFALQSNHSLAWSYPINQEIDRQIQRLLDQKSGPYSRAINNLLPIRSKWNLVAQSYRWRINFYGRNIAGIDETTQSLKQLLIRGVYVSRRFHHGKHHRQQFEALERIRVCHQALAAGIQFEKEGHSLEALTQWAKGVALTGVSLDQPPERRLPGKSPSADIATNRIRTQDGWGYAIVNGHLWLWNPQDQIRPMLSKEPAVDAGWHPAGIEARRIRLGANGLGYLLTESGVLIQLPTRNRATKDTVARIQRSIEEGGLLRIGPVGGTTESDFAISPAGSVVYTLAPGQPGQLGYIKHTLLTGRRFAHVLPALITIPDHLKPSSSSIVAIAFDGFDRRGSLYLSENGDNYCRAHRLDTGGWSFEKILPSNLPLHLKKWLNPGGEQSLDQNLSDQFFGQFAGLTGYSDTSVTGYVQANRRRVLPGQVRKEAWHEKLPAPAFVRRDFPEQKLTTRWKQHWQIFWREFAPTALQRNAKERQRQAEASLDQRLEALADPVGNGPGQLLKHNFAGPDEFSSIAHAIGRFNHSLRHGVSPMIRALQARDPRINPVDHYSRIIGELPAGWSIQSRQGHGRGGDVDGVPPVLGLFKPILALLGHRHLPPELVFHLVNTFNIRYTPAWMKAKDSAFKFTKTTEGIEFSVTTSKQKEKTLLSANFSVGGGTALSSVGWGLVPLSLRRHLPWFFDGVEYHGTRGTNARSEITATWSIPHDDHGSVPRFLEEFFSGKLDPIRLLNLSQPATVTAGHFESKLRTHPLQWLPGVFGWTQGFLHLQSEQLYGYVKQHAWGKTLTKGHAITRGPNGTIEQVIDSRVKTVESRSIHVQEEQTPDLSFSLFGFGNLLRVNVKEHPLVRVKTNKDRRRRSLGEQRSMSHGYDVKRDRNGQILSVFVEVQTDNPRAHDLARTDRIHPEAEHFTPQNVPQIAELLDAHPHLGSDILRIQQSGEPVQISLELKEGWRKLVQAFEGYRRGEPVGYSVNRLLTNPFLRELYPNFGGLSPDADGLHKLITRLRDHPGCWKIVRIEATETRVHSEDFTPGIWLFRARSNASTFRTNCNASIRIEETPTGTTLEVTGRMLRPVIPANFYSIDPKSRSIRTEPGISSRLAITPATGAVGILPRVPAYERVQYKGRHRPVSRGP